MRRGQHKAACIHGHAYTPENTVFKGGVRRCRACRVMKLAKDREARRSRSKPIYRRNCPECGRDYDTTNMQRRFCSKQCAGRCADRRTRGKPEHERTCRVCGAAVVVRGGQTRTCSVECRRVLKRKSRQRDYRKHRQAYIDRANEWNLSDPVRRARIARDYVKRQVLKDIADPVLREIRDCQYELASWKLRHPGEWKPWVSGGGEDPSMRQLASQLRRS